MCADRRVCTRQRARFSRNWLSPSFSQLATHDAVEGARRKKNDVSGDAPVSEKGKERDGGNCAGRKEVHGAPVRRDWKCFFVVVALSLNRRYCRVIGGLIASKTQRNTRRRIAREQEGKLGAVAFVKDRRNFRRRADASADETRIPDRERHADSRRARQCSPRWNLAPVCRVDFIAINDNW